MLDSVPEAGPADGGGLWSRCRPCGPAQTVSYDPLTQLTSASQPFSEAVARKGAAVTMAFDGLVRFSGYCLASGCWSVRWEASAASRLRKLSDGLSMQALSRQSCCQVWQVRASAKLAAGWWVSVEGSFSEAGR